MLFTNKIPGFGGLQMPDLGGMFDAFGKGPAELDKLKKETKDELDALRKTDQQNIGTNVLNEGLKGLRKDLRELKIKDPARIKDFENLYIQYFHRETAGQRLKSISESHEFKGLNEFVDEYAKYAKLEVLIEECKKNKSSGPLESWAKSIAENAPSLAGILGWILSFVKGEKEEGKKQSKFDKKLETLAAILSGEEKPEEGEEGKPEKVQKTKEELEKEIQKKKEAEALAKNSKEAVKKGFEEAGITFNESKYVEGVISLHQEGIDTTEKIVKFIKDANNGKLGAVYKALKERMGEEAKKVKFSLMDAYLYEKKLNPSQITEVKEGLTKITKNDPAKMQKFFDQVPKLVRYDKAIAKYLETEQLNKTT